MIRRIIALAVLAVSALVLAACGTSGVPAATGAPAPAATQEPGPAAEEGTEASNILVAYFSWSGNTAEMAAYIAGRTGGDLGLPRSYRELGVEMDDDILEELALASKDKSEHGSSAGAPPRKATIDEYKQLIMDAWNGVEISY